MHEKWWKGEDLEHIPRVWWSKEAENGIGRWVLKKFGKRVERDQDIWVWNESGWPLSLYRTRFLDRSRRCREVSGFNAQSFIRYRGGVNSKILLCIETVLRRYWVGKELKKLFRCIEEVSRYCQEKPWKSHLKRCREVSRRYRVGIEMHKKVIFQGRVCNHDNTWWV